MEKNNHPTNNFDFDFTLIANFFKGLDRQGPGGREQTLRAVDFIREQLPQSPRIADLGCGTGGQTVILAQALPDCRITAVDMLSPMIDGVRERVEAYNLHDRIMPLQGSMDALPFAEESLDVIWAEGSIYNIGYRKGLEYWRQFIKPNGFVVVSECCWLSDKRPAQMQWFTDNFAEIDTIAQKLSILQSAGYEPVAHFIIPAECWTDNYYKPMKVRMESFVAENFDNPSARMLVDQLLTEIEQYGRYGDCYGYVFFVGRKL